MKRFGFFTLLMSWLLLSGCSSVPSRETPTPTPDMLQATVVALQTQNAQLATQVAGVPATIENWPTPTPLPSATPTATSTPTATPTATPTRVVVHRPAATARPQLPQILSFTTNPDEVDIGQSVTLSWNTEHATRAVIHQYSSSGRNADIDVAPNGSTKVSIAGLYDEFVLTAYNPAGDPAVSSVQVYARCPYTYFFTPPADNYHWDCPAGQASTANAAEQYFEGGRMIWIDTLQRIYVLLNDGSLYTYEDTWTADQPDVDSGITPPAGRFKPIRGFGKVWNSDAYIQSRLGWAMAPEKGYQAQYQQRWVDCCTAPYQWYVREVDQRITYLTLGGTSAGYWSLTVY